MINAATTVQLFTRQQARMQSMATSDPIVKRDIQYFQDTISTIKTAKDFVGNYRLLNFATKAFGLQDMAGNVYQWVADCAHDSYAGAPADGAAWIEKGDCRKRMARGGSWADIARNARSAARMALDADLQSPVVGLRVARDLSPPVSK